VCCVSIIYFASLEFGLLVLITQLSSLELVQKCLPVCSMYLKTTITTFQLIGSTFIKDVSIEVFWFQMIFIVFVVLKNVRMLEFFNSLAIILFSLPVYVKVAHFCLSFGGVFFSIGLVCVYFCICVGNCC
jgi:hypothetical protein